MSRRPAPRPQPTHGGGEAVQARDLGAVSEMVDSGLSIHFKYLHLHLYLLITTVIGSGVSAVKVVSWVLTSQFC